MTDPPLDPARLEQELLGGERRHTPDQVSELAGVPADDAKRLWRALGFAEVDDDAVVFTDKDVEALRRVTDIVERGFVDADTQVAMARALGQALSRLAEGQVAAVTMELVERGIEPGSDAAIAVSAELTPMLEQLITYVWRRHLAAAAGRSLVASPEELVARTMLVGFADIVGFTSMTRSVDEHELGQLIEAFESAASDIVAEREGRIVKTLGDEVLFVADDVLSGADTGLCIAERMASDGLPPVRVGMAYGTVLARLGDVYGDVVNTASRLTSVARPGTVLVDDALAASLDGHDTFLVKPLRARPVRGIKRLQPHVLRRPSR